MSLLPDDMEKADPYKEGSAAPLSMRKRAVIERNLKRNLKAEQALAEVTNPLSSETKTSASIAEADVFWDRKSIVFVSWYWPGCIVTGLLIGVLVADLLR